MSPHEGGGGGKADHPDPADRRRAPDTPDTTPEARLSPAGQLLKHPLVYGGWRLINGPYLPMEHSQRLWLIKAIVWFVAAHIHVLVPRASRGDGAALPARAPEEATPDTAPTGERHNQNVPDV